MFLAFVIASTVGMWWCTAFVMLGGQVRWRVLFRPAALTAVGTAMYGFAADVWMPRSVVENGEQFGYFGVFMTIASWLVGLAFVVVRTTSAGPALAFDGGTIGRLVRGHSGHVTAQDGPTSRSRTLHDRRQRNAR